MSATIYDVAKHAGVSVATVSRIVNASGQVSEKTALKVQESIEALKFRPNALGRNLSTSKTATIGVLLPSMSNPVFADAVAGINEVALEHAYTLMLTMTEYVEAAEETVVNTLLSYQPEGVILTVADPDNSVALDILKDCGIPHILIFNQLSKQECPTLTVDNVAAGRDVARAFIDMGHKRLAMVAGSFAKSDRAEARWKGFCEEAVNAGLAEPDLYEIEFINPNIDTIAQKFEDDKASAPSALFCSNDLLAISTISALQRNNIRVPEDISVIGFDGISISSQIHPTLATVSQPSKEMGREAMHALLSLLAGEQKPSATVLPHTLKLGESAGPAGKH